MRSRAVIKEPRKLTLRNLKPFEQGAYKAFSMGFKVLTKESRMSSLSQIFYNLEPKIVKVAKFDLVSFSPSMTMPEDHWDHFEQNF